MSNEKYEDLLKLVPGVLQAIGVAAQLAGAAPAVPRILATASAVIESFDIPAAIAEMKKLKSLVELMVQESREPTEAEWESLQIRADAAYDAIMAVNLDETTNKTET